MAGAPFLAAPLPCIALVMPAISPPEALNNGKMARAGAMALTMLTRNGTNVSPVLALVVDKIFETNTEAPHTAINIG